LAAVKARALVCSAWDRLLNPRLFGVTASGES
jgi:hypothetical protein